VEGPYRGRDGGATLPGEPAGVGRGIWEYRGGEIGLITDWVDFIGSGYACHQKRRSGKASDERSKSRVFLGMQKKI
jgi:hypothetical protein